VVTSPLTQANYAHTHQCTRLVLNPLFEWKWDTAVDGVSRVDGYSAVAAAVSFVLWLSAALCQLYTIPVPRNFVPAVGRRQRLVPVLRYCWRTPCVVLHNNAVSFAVEFLFSPSSMFSDPPSVLSWYYFLLFFRFLFFVSFPSLYSVLLFCLLRIYLLVVPRSSLFYHVFLSNFSLLGSFASLQRLY
jgi:hypothetical protein